MKLIDADLLELDTEWNEHEDGFMSYSKTQIDEAETVKAIPIDKVEQIKADIFNACSDKYHMPVYKLDCDEFFEIIDKTLDKEQNE